MIEIEAQNKSINVWPAFVDLVLIALFMIIMAGSVLILASEKDSLKYKQIKMKKQTFRKEFEQRFPPATEKEKVWLLPDTFSRLNEHIIVFGSDLLFDSLDHDLSVNGRLYLTKLKDIFISAGRANDFFSEIQVLGHTDDVNIYNYPFSRADKHNSITVLDMDKRLLKQTNRLLWKKIQSKQFPTNWELSAARAVSVVRFFTEEQQFIYAPNETDWYDEGVEETLKLEKKDLALNSEIIWTATGCSKYQPRKNFTGRIFHSPSEEKAWNRRIEIRLIYSYGEPGASTNMPRGLIKKGH